MLSHSTVVSFGTLMNVGASPSPTVMTCVAELVLPQLSVAVQIRVIVCPHGLSSSNSSYVMTTSVSQLSVAVTTPSAGVAGTSVQLEFTSVGMPANTGAVVSSTVIVCVACPLFPHASVAVHVRVIV